MSSFKQNFEEEKKLHDFVMFVCIANLLSHCFGSENRTNIRLLLQSPQSGASSKPIHVFQLSPLHPQRRPEGKFEHHQQTMKHIFVHVMGFANYFFIVVLLQH